MPQENITNPYTLTEGYESRHDYPVYGYGLAIESIKHFLFDEGFRERINILDEIDEDEVDDLLQTHDLGDQGFQYYIGYNIESEFLIYNPSVFDNRVNPQTREIVPTKAELDEIFVKIITLIYVIPDNLQTKLTDFVHNYAGYITDCDFS